VALAAAILANYWTTYLSESTILDSPENETHHSLPFIVVDIPGKGKGAIASRDIKVGLIQVMSRLNTSLSIVRRSKES